MGRFSVEKIHLKGPKLSRIELQFSYNVNISKDGIFTTTLPGEIVRLLEKGGISFSSNRAGNKGYFIAATLKELITQVLDVSKEYMSRELKEEKIVLLYIIQTTCSYCLDSDGNVVPNGTPEWIKSDEYHWKQGTINQHATACHPFGIQVYVKPNIKQTYVYKSGSVITEYTAITNHDTWDEEVYDDKYYLKWLAGLSNIAAPNGEAVQELDYDEQSAKFFVELITSICKLNERIKDSLKSDVLQKLINQNIKLLG